MRDERGRKGDSYNKGQSNRRIRTLGSAQWDLLTAPHISAPRKSENTTESGFGRPFPKWELLNSQNDTELIFESDNSESSR